MLSKLKTTLAGSYKGLTAFALAVAVLSGLPVIAAPATQSSPSPQIVDPVLDRVERNCVFRYTVDNSITKAVNLRTVTEITMDKNGAINVQTINGTRDINISVPARADKVTFLQGVLYQWERCIATR